MMSQGSNHTSSADGQLNLSVASSAEDFVQEYTSVLFEFIIPGVLLNTIGEEREILYPLQTKLPQLS